MFAPLFTKELNRNIGTALRDSIKQSFGFVCEKAISGYKNTREKRRK